MQGFQGGSAVQQAIHGGRATGSSSHVQGGLAIGIARFQRGAGHQQELHDARDSGPSGPVERSSPASIAGLDIGSIGQQEGHDFRIGVVGGRVQRPCTSGCGLVDVGSPRDQQVGHIGAIHAGGSPQSGVALAILGFDQIGVLVQQLHSQAGIGVLDGPKQLLQILGRSGPAKSQDQHGDSQSQNSAAKHDASFASGWDGPAVVAGELHFEKRNTVNPSNRVWLFFGVLSFVICFVAGVTLAPKGPGAAKTTSAASPDVSQTPAVFSAPHKPDVDQSRKTPEPDPRFTAPADPPVAPPSGGLAFWVYQDNSPLYAGMGLNQPVVQRLPCNTPLSLLREEDEWVEVQVLGGASGWMKRAQVGDHPPPGAVGPRPADALLSLQGFFQQLNAHDYARAYDHLSFDFKRDLPYRTFARGYAGLEQVSMRVVRVQNLGPSSQIFYVEMLCQERPKARAYSGEYTMVLEQNHWFIAQAGLKEIAPNSVPPFPSQTAPMKPAFADPTPDPEEDDLGP